MKPSERINRTYELKRTTVEIPLDNRPAQVPITVNLELSPRPQLILGCEFSSADAAATNEMNCKGEVSVCLDNGRKIDTVAGNRWQLGGGTIHNILIPKSEPITVRNGKVFSTVPLAHHAPLGRVVPLQRCPVHRIGIGSSSLITPQLHQTCSEYP